MTQATDVQSFLLGTFFEDVAGLLPGGMAVNTSAPNRIMLNTLGEQWYVTEDQLQRLRRVTQWAGKNLPHFRSYIIAICDAVVGPGLTFAVEGDDAKPVQAWLTAVVRANRKHLDWEMLVEYALSCGEFIIRVTEGREGPIARLVPVEFVRTNAGGTPQNILLGITSGQNAEYGQFPVVFNGLNRVAIYGVILDESEPTEPIAYVYQPPTGGGGYIIPAEEVVHFKAAGDVFTPRGVSPCLPVVDDMRVIKMLSTKLLQEASTKASISMIIHRKALPNATGGALLPAGAQNQDSNNPFVTIPGGGVILYLPPEDEAKAVFPSDGLDREGISVVYRDKLRQIAAALGVASYTLDKDMDSQNRSNTEVAEREGRLTMQRWQARFYDAFGEVLRKMLEIGVVRGELPESALDCEIIWQGPDLTAQTREALVSESERLYALGLLSREQVLLQLGYDPEQETERQDDEDQPTGDGDDVTDTEIPDDDNPDNE